MTFYNQRRATGRCPECFTGQIYQDHARKYNARNAAGVEVCASCAAEAIIKATRERVINASTIES